MSAPSKISSKSSIAKAGKRPRSDAATSPESADVASIRSLIELQTSQIHERLTQFEISFAGHTKEIEKSVEELKETIVFQNHEIERLKNKVADLEGRMEQKEKEIQEEVDKLSSYIARENLVFFGIKETGKKQEEDVEALLMELYVEKLKIAPERARQIEYQRVHRIPATKGTRPIKARFLRYIDVALILKQAKNLKGNRDKIFISNDLPKRVREQRQLQVPAMKAARTAGKLAYFSRSEPTKLFIDHVWLKREQQIKFVENLERTNRGATGGNWGKRPTNEKENETPGAKNGGRPSAPIRSRDLATRELRSSDLAPGRANSKATVAEVHHSSHDASTRRQANDHTTDTMPTASNASLVHTRKLHEDSE